MQYDFKSTITLKEWIRPDDDVSERLVAEFYTGGLFIGTMTKCPENGDTDWKPGPEGQCIPTSALPELYKALTEYFLERNIKNDNIPAT